MSGRDERTVLFELPQVISGTLVCTQGTVAGRSWTLGAGTFTIGRQPGCDLHLGTEPGVSKQHAKVQAEGDQYILVDLESRNGTIVNGRPIQRKRLFDGDEIRICGCVLRFNQEGGAIDAPAPSEASGFADGAGTSPEMPDMTLEPPSVSQSSLSGPSLSGPSLSGPSVPTPQEAQAPTMEWVPPAGDALDPSAATVRAPLPEERYKGASSWFVVGLLGVVLVGGGAWAGLRFLGDELLGPMTAPDDVAAQGDAGPARADGGAATVAASGTRDAGVAGAGTKKDAGAAAAAGGSADAGAAADDEDAGAGAVDEPDVDEPDVDEPDVDEPDVDEPVDKPITTPRPAAPSGPSDWFDVRVDRPTPLAVKSKASGTIASVSVADGDSVKRGTTILTLEGGGGADPDEIANLKESIASLEEIAESQPSAADMLEQEKSKLARLLAKSKAPKVVAPASGTVSGLSMTAGGSVSSGDVVCTIARGGSPTASIQLTGKDARRAKRGARVELELSSGGTADGTVKSSRRRGGKTTVVLDVGGASLDDVSRARFP
jgi:biotin carboxyl carrier protein